MFSLDFINTDHVVGALVGGAVGATAGYFYGKSVGREEAEKSVGLKQLERMESEMDSILSAMEKRIQDHKGQEPQVPAPATPVAPASVVVVEQQPPVAPSIDAPPAGHTWYQDGTGKALLVKNETVATDMLARIQQLEAELAKAKAKPNNQQHNQNQHNNSGNKKQKNHNNQNQHNNQQQQQATAKVVHVADDNAMGHAMANAGVVVAA